MLSVWTKHLRDEKEQNNFYDYVRKCKPLLDRLGELIKEEEDKLLKSERSERVYDLGNWDYLQAHKNGYGQCLDYFKQLITLDRKEKK